MRGREAGPGGCGLQRQTRASAQLTQLRGDRGQLFGQAVVVAVRALGSGVHTSD
ncbi:hypothetical protein [Streptomyces lavendulae]